MVKPFSFATKPPLILDRKVIQQLSLDPELITEILKEVKQRKGQDKFRKKLLTVFKTCALCGVIAEHTRASHIKPWATSNDLERLDIDNGLLLCPNHDYLFDKGLITFEETGVIKISNERSSIQRMSFNINPSLRIQMNNKKKQYLDYHRQFIFKP